MFFELTLVKPIFKKYNRKREVMINRLVTKKGKKQDLLLIEIDLVALGCTEKEERELIRESRRY